MRRYPELITEPSDLEPPDKARGKSWASQRQAIDPSFVKEREEPISNATINTLFASLAAAFSYFIEQGG